MADADRLRERLGRVHSTRQARHRRVDNGEGFSTTIGALRELAYAGAQVSASVRELTSGRVLLAIDDRVVLPIGSLGAVLLLCEVSARISNDDAFAFELLDKRTVAPVSGAGLWTRLAVPILPIADLAVLIGATGDVLATNALLERIGLDAVRKRGELLGVTRTGILDHFRDERGPDQAPQMSVGCADDLAALFGALVRGEVVDRVTSDRVMAWLAQNADLSLVASAFGLDPLAHTRAIASMSLVNKTSIGAGVYAEAGAVRGPRSALSYAVTVQLSDQDLAGRLRIFEALHAVGNELVEFIH